MPDVQLSDSSMDREEKLKLAREKKFQNKKKNKQEQPDVVVTNVTDTTPDQNESLTLDSNIQPIYPLNLTENYTLEDQKYSQQQDIDQQNNAIFASEEYGYAQQEEQVENQISLEQQCQYYSDMYQQVVQQNNMFAQELQFQQQAVVNLQFEYGELNHQYSEILQLLESRDREIAELQQHAHETSGAEKKISELIAEIDYWKGQVVAESLDNTVTVEQDRIKQLQEQLQQEKESSKLAQIAIDEQIAKLAKKEHDLKVLESELNEQRQKLEQGQDWLRMQQQELNEKQELELDDFSKKQQELQLKEINLNEREKRVNDLQAELQARQYELDNQYVKFDTQKLEFEDYVASSSMAQNSLLVQGVDSSITEGAVQMSPEQVQQWIDYYNSKCSELDYIKEELLVEKESYGDLTRQLQQQLESYNTSMKNYPINEFSNEEIQQRELLVKQREEQLELHEQPNPNRNQDTNPLDIILQQLDSLKINLEPRNQEKETTELYSAHLAKMNERLDTSDRLNKQLMDSITLLNRQLDILKPSITTDFCTAITELSKTNVQLWNQITNQSKPMEKYSSTSSLHDISGLSEHSRSLLREVMPTEAVRDLVRSRLSVSRNLQ